MFTPAISRRMAIPTTDGFVLIDIYQLVYARAVGNYTRFVLLNENPLVSSHTLKYFQAQLEDRGFLRVHKSYIINSIHIVKYLRKGSVILADGTELEVSRSFRTTLLQAIT